MVDNCGAIEIDTQIATLRVYENSVRMEGPKWDTEKKTQES